MLSSVLKKLSPQLSVITGPVDCGKSLLTRKVVDLVEDEMKMPVVYLNLRDYSFNTVDALVAVLHTKMSTWIMFNLFWAKLKARRLM